MPRVTIELARQEDDAGLREQARLTPMQGDFSLAFLREQFLHRSAAPG